MRNLYPQRDFGICIAGAISAVNADVIYKIACTRGHTQGFPSSMRGAQRTRVMQSEYGKAGSAVRKKIARRTDLGA